MFLLLTLLAAAPPPAPPRPRDPVIGEIYAAIWNDLQLNALIGNGNWIASLWYNAGRDVSETPDLHARNLRCHRRGHLYHCSFTLFRDGGVTRVLGEEAPDRLTCDATFHAAMEGGWAIRHLPPPPDGGHSRTTMRCKRAPGA